MKRTGLLILSSLLLQHGGVFLTAGRSSTAQEEDTQEQQDEPGKKESTDRPQDPNSLRPYWKDGVRLETPDKRVSLKIGGRIQADWMWINEDQSVREAIGDQISGSEFRRTRLYMSGDLYGNLSFKSQFDFAGGSTALKDVFVALKLIPGFGNVKVGHYKEPFSLEELTSSNYMTFVERSLANVFSSSRNVGLTVYNSQLDQRLTWAAGVFRDTDNGGTSLGDGIAGTFRLTGVPALSQQKDRLVHMGASYSLRRPSDGVLRWRQRPELHLTDRYVDTRSFPADQIQLLVLEGAVVNGPFSIQSEYTYSATRSPTRRRPCLRRVLHLFQRLPDRRATELQSFLGVLRPAAAPKKSLRRERDLGPGSWRSGIPRST